MGQQLPGNLSRREKAVSRRRQVQIRGGLTIIAGVALLAVVLLLFYKNIAAQKAIPLQVGAVPGDFQLKDLDGKTVHLSDYKGKVVLLNAWATWCPTCKAEMPLLNQYYQAHVGDGFVVLAINAGDPQSATASFADQYRLRFPVLLDPGTAFLDQMRINSFPTSVLIGKDGKVRSIHVGIFTSISIETEVTPLLY